MLSFDECLKQIKTAVYGEEVRTAIHDSIKQINDIAILAKDSSDEFQINLNNQFETFKNDLNMDVSEFKNTMNKNFLDFETEVNNNNLDFQVAIRGEYEEFKTYIESAADNANIKAIEAEQASQKANQAAEKAATSSNEADKATKKALDAAEMANQAAAGVGLQKKVLDHIPDPSEMLDNVIYLVPSEKPGINNIFNEYLLVDGKIELIGSTQVDLSEYVKSSDLSEVATSGDYSDLKNAPTIPTLVSELSNDLQYQTKSEVTTAVNGRVPTSRTINGKKLTANITLTHTDVKAKPAMAYQVNTEISTGDTWIDGSYIYEYVVSETVNFTGKPGTSFEITTLPETVYTATLLSLTGFAVLPNGNKLPLPYTYTKTDIYGLGIRVDGNDGRLLMVSGESRTEQNVPVIIVLKYAR